MSSNILVPFEVMSLTAALESQYSRIIDSQKKKNKKDKLSISGHI